MGGWRGGWPDAWTGKWGAGQQPTGTESQVKFKPDVTGLVMEGGPAPQGDVY